MKANLKFKATYNNKTINILAHSKDDAKDAAVQYFAPRCQKFNRYIQNDCAHLLFLNVTYA